MEKSKSPVCFFTLILVHPQTICSAEVCVDVLVSGLWSLPVETIPGGF